jgi:hypothetical protein
MLTIDDEPVDLGIFEGVRSSTASVDIFSMDYHNPSIEVIGPRV